MVSPHSRGRFAILKQIELLLPDLVLHFAEYAMHLPAKPAAADLVSWNASDDDAGIAVLPSRPNLDPANHAPTSALAPQLTMMEVQNRRDILPVVRQRLRDCCTWHNTRRSRCRLRGRAITTRTSFFSHQFMMLSGQKLEYPCTMIRAVGHATRIRPTIRTNSPNALLDGSMFDGCSRPHET